MFLVMPTKMLPGTAIAKARTGWNAIFRLWVLRAILVLFLDGGGEQKFESCWVSNDAPKRRHL
jgi:hypothetical protein